MERLRHAHLAHAARAPCPIARQAYDPGAFGLLSAIYSGRHALLDRPAEPSGEPHRLLPTRGGAASTGRNDVTREELTLQVDNSAGTDALEVFWIDAASKERRYAFVDKGARHAQRTYPGHVWELRPVSKGGRPRRYRTSHRDVVRVDGADCSEAAD